MIILDQLKIIDSVAQLLNLSLVKCRREFDSHPFPHKTKLQSLHSVKRKPFEQLTNHLMVQTKSSIRTRKAK